LLFVIVQLMFNHPSDVRIHSIALGEVAYWPSKLTIKRTKSPTGFPVHVLR
jgi:hypothetical protein